MRRIRKDKGSEATRDAALRIHKAVGFQEVGVEDGQVQLEITYAEYLKKR